MAKKSDHIVLKAPVYSQEGKEVSNIELSPVVFDVMWNADLVHEVVVGIQGNVRSNTAHTKNRGEVRGGGKKPWKQKGTGRARHGSTRSPIWRGGGISHGPRNDRDYTRKINKNARAKALACVLSQKYTQNTILFIDTFNFTVPKTKDARTFLNVISTLEGKKDLGTKKQNAVLILLANRDENVERSFHNFGNVCVSHVKDVNPVELLTYKYIVVAKPTESQEIFVTRVATKVARVSQKESKTPVMKK